MQQQKFKNTNILIKGSRSMKMENALDGYEMARL
jgi:hypothetical protein